MDIETILHDAGATRSERALRTFVERYLDPAFGALPKGETELLVLDLLTDLGALSARATAYELVSRLRIPRARARRLIYERDLRKQRPEDLDAEVRALLSRPRIVKNGDLFVLDVDNPLVADHLHARVVELGYVADGSFSASVVRLPLEAVVALVAYYVDPDGREAVRLALVRAGAPDTSFQGVLTAVLRKVGESASRTRPGACS
jgi:hypothetical protein